MSLTSMVRNAPLSRGGGGGEGLGGLTTEAGDDVLQDITLQDIVAAEDPGGKVKAALDKIVEFVPVEAVTFYGVVLGVFSPLDDQGRWIVFAAGVVLTVAWVTLTSIDVNRPGSLMWPPRIPRQKLAQTLGLLIFGLIGFTAWVATLPSSPFLEISEDATKLGSVAVVVLTPLMALIAPWIGLQQS